MFGIWQDELNKPSKKSPTAGGKKEKEEEQFCTEERDRATERWKWECEAFK